MIAQKISNELRARSSLQKAMLVVLCVRLFAAQFITPYNILSDSYSYINFPFSEFFQLQFDGRTPVYPAIIRLCYVIFGEVNFYLALTTLQQVVGIISVVFLYKAIVMVFKNEKTAFWLTVLYGACPSVYSWDYCLLTESFALSGTVIFLYLMMRYIQTPRFWLGATSISLMFVLTFLRPTFLLFDAVLFAFWIGRLIFCKEERKLAVKLCLCSSAVFAVVVVYACIFYQSFGYYSISDPMPRQSLVTNIQLEYYLESSNELYTETVREGLMENGWSAWSASTYVREIFTDVEIIEITNEYISTHRLTYAKDMYDRAGSIAETKFSNYYSYDYNSLFIGLLPFYKTYEGMVAPIRIAHLYAIMFIELIIAIALWVKTKRPPWVHLGLAIFVWGIVCSTVLATCDEYPRTLICTLPLAYFACAGYATKLYDRIFQQGVRSVTMQSEIDG